MDMPTNGTADKNATGDADGHPYRAAATAMVSGMGAGLVLFMLLLCYSWAFASARRRRPQGHVSEAADAVIWQSSQDAVLLQEFVGSQTTLPATTSVARGLGYPSTCTQPAWS